MTHVSCREEMINVIFFFDALIPKSVKDVYKHRLSSFLFCHKITVTSITL